VNLISTFDKHETAPGTHYGRIATITDDRIVTKAAGEGERGSPVARNVRVTRDGKPCRVDDLKLGVLVRVTVGNDDDSTAIRIDCLPCD
jgi:hypothetical protein